MYLQIRTGIYVHVFNLFCTIYNLTIQLHMYRSQHCVVCNATDHHLLLKCHSHLNNPLTSTGENHLYFPVMVLEENGEMLKSWYVCTHTLHYNVHMYDLDIHIC